MRLVSEMVAPSCRSATRTFLRLASSQLGIWNVPGLCWLTPSASCKAWTCWTFCGFAGSTSMRTTTRTYRVPILLGQGVTACAVIDRRGVLILVDWLHRHEAPAGVGQRDCHRAGVEVEHRTRIQRVAVRPYNTLLIERHRLAEMQEFAKAAPFGIEVKIDV